MVVLTFGDTCPLTLKPKSLEFVARVRQETKLLGFERMLMYPGVARVAETLAIVDNVLEIGSLLASGYVIRVDVRIANAAPLAGVVVLLAHGLLPLLIGGSVRSLPPIVGW